MSQDRFVGLVTISLKTLIMLIVIWTFWMLGPLIESKYLPVVGKLQILHVEKVADHKTQLMVAFTKKRDCVYVGITWFRQFDSNTLIRVPLVLERQPTDTGSPNRPMGRQVAGPWTVDVNPDEIIDKSVVDVYHNCHILWTTRTRIYP